jgi:thiamine biosynthesis protein ThiS
MTLTVNGEETEISGPLTLAGLIKHLQLVPERVAVERNREIVPRGRWAETSMEEGDRLEIVHFVGGGCLPVIPRGDADPPMRRDPQAVLPPQAVLDPVWIIDDHGYFNAPVPGLSAAVFTRIIQESPLSGSFTETDTWNCPSQETGPILQRLWSKTAKREGLAPIDEDHS